MQSTRTCAFDGCDNASKSNGLCSGHYQQHHKGQELRPLIPKLTLSQRFWAKVNKTQGCWHWSGCITPQGYGLFWDGKKRKTSHRVSWELTNGTVPDGMDLDHRCANRGCVRPDHLRVVTRSQNMQHRTTTASNNTSGVRGVTWDKENKAWRVQVVLNKRPYYGGRHSTLEAAESAAKALRARLFTHDDHDQWVKDQKEKS